MSGNSTVNVFLDRVKESLHKYEKQLELDKFVPLNVAHEKTGQPRIYIAIAAAAVLALVIIQLLGLSFISNLFAFVPIYASFKALRSETKEDDRAWLTYWVVYSSLGLFESFFDVLFFWMPLYYVAKIAFLIYCYSPQTKGAAIIYERFLGPLFGLVVSEAESIRAQAASKRPQQ